MNLFIFGVVVNFWALCVCIISCWAADLYEQYDYSAGLFVIILYFAALIAITIACGDFLNILT